MIGVGWSRAVECHGDRAVILRHDSPISLIVAHGAAMKSIQSAMLVCWYVVGVAIDSEGAVLDSVCVATNNSS